MPFITAYHTSAAITTATGIRLHGYGTSGAGIMSLIVKNAPYATVTTDCTDESAYIRYIRPSLGVLSVGTSREFLKSRFPIISLSHVYAQ